MISICQLIGILSFVFTGVIYFFNNLEKFEILISWILRLFSWINKKTRLKAINTQIQAKINTAVESIETEVEGVLPNPIKIEWLKGGEEHASIEDNEIIVRLHNDFNNARNIVVATMLYLQEGLLRLSRPHTFYPLQKAIDLEMAWKILHADEETNIGSYFLNEIHTPTTLENDEIGICGSKVKSIKSGGMFTRVLLRELRGLGRKVAGSLPSRETKEETKLFLDFLHTITSSDQGSIYPLNFLGKNIKVGIVLVARFQTLSMGGLRTHKNWLKKKVEMGAETVYVCGMGSKNINLARNVAQWGQQEGHIQIVKSQTFNNPTRSGKPGKAVVITCHSTRSRVDIILSPEEEIQASLVRHIPEIAGGKIGIIDIAREVGVQSKVVVHCDPEYLDDFINICEGENNTNLKIIKDEIQESIWFIQWSDDINLFLIECLGIPTEKVISKSINTQKNIAEIIVIDSITAARAIGTKGINIKLTKKITGFKNIKILTKAEAEEGSNREVSQSPEEYLTEKVSNQIPEIANGSIEIIDLVREPGIQSKVVIRSINDDLDAIKICLGRNNCNIDALKNDLGEMIWFVKWVEDFETYVINCIGISRFRVRKITFDKHLNKVVVVVKDKRSAAMCVGENGVNIKQTTQLLKLNRIDVYKEDDLK